MAPDTRGRTKDQLPAAHRARTIEPVLELRISISGHEEDVVRSATAADMLARFKKSFEDALASMESARASIRDLTKQPDPGIYHPAFVVQFGPDVLVPSIPFATGTKLGGHAVFGKDEITESDLASLVMRGFPTKVVDILRQHARLTDSEIDHLVIPKRTLRHRKEKQQPLTKEESDRAARIARVVSHAEQVFEDTGKADAWLRRELKALGGSKPLELAETEAGARIVEELLEKIAWGAAA